MIQPVILCGGSGTRLWPLSRPDRPKPFLKLLGDRTLFQQALDRVADPRQFAEPLMVGGSDHVAWIREQAGAHRLIVEPCARNTAPAIALAACESEPDTVMLVCPSDHHIADTQAFTRAVDDAASLAREGWLVSLGITPDRPETGYGYIERGAALGSANRVARFVEKPDAERATAFLATGNFAWNAGIFVFRAGDLLEELAAFRPEMAGLVRSAQEQAVREAGVIRPASEPFGEIRSESIDYAIMENTDRAAVVSVSMGWSDIGNWDALLAARKAAGLGGRPGAEHRLIDCRNVEVFSDDARVSAIGLENLFVIVDGNDILVVSRDRLQDVGRLAPDAGR